MGSVSPEVPAVLARGTGLQYHSGRIGLRALDLRVDAGEVLAVLGPNGSGKSTLLRLLATDLRPTEGVLSLLGQPVCGRLTSIRRQIGYAADTPVHFQVFTGAENAELFQTLVPPPGGDHTGHGPEKDGSRDRIRDLLCSFDLDEVSGTPVSEYSFGMSRKLLLLESLALAPPLLLLDEPSVGLDPRGMSTLKRAIQARGRDGGAVIVASNEIRQIPMWADRVLFFHRGELVEDAPLPALLRRLEGRTRIEIDLADPETPASDIDLSDIEGVESAQPSSTGIIVQSSQAGRPLPALTSTLLAAGRRLRDIRVREPDLGDLFLALTGESLDATSDGSWGEGGSGS